MGNKKSQTRYTREEILKSSVFAGYQKDFVSVILDKPTYTIAEAKKAVSAHFKEKEK